MQSGPARCVAATISTAAVIACVSIGHGVYAAGPPAAVPRLVVQPLGGNYAEDRNLLRVDLDLGSERPAARINIYAPSRFELTPTRPAGTPVGQADVYLRDPTRPGKPPVFRAGAIAAAGASVDEAALRCSPGEHIGVWQLSFADRGSTYTLPISISKAGTALRLDLCPGEATATPAWATISELVLALDDVRPPTKPAAYEWRAIVTPQSATGDGAVTAAAYEVRAIVPVPYTLTLTGGHRAGDYRTTLRGTLRRGGRPLAGAEVDVVRLGRLVTAHGIRFVDSPVAVVTTTHGGGYAVSFRQTATQGFVAASPETTIRCNGGSPAPGGCRSMTIAGIESNTLTISVP